MKMKLQRFFGHIMNFILGMQLSILPHLNAWAQDAHEISLPSLFNSIQAYEREIQGVPAVNSCREENRPQMSSQELNIENILGLSFFQCYQGACQSYSYSYDRERAMALRSEECMTGGQDGFIQTFAKEILAKESDGEEPPRFLLTNPIVRSLTERSQSIKNAVERYVWDDDFAAERRAALLSLYTEKVLMPTRDLIVAFKSYTPSEYNGVAYYENLLMDFPTDIAPGNSEESALLAQFGMQSARDKIKNGNIANPNYLIISDQMFGRSSMSFDELSSMERDARVLLKVPTAKNYVRGMKWMTLQMMVAQIDVFNQIIGRQEDVEIPRSCSNLMLGGQLPATIRMTRVEGQGEVLTQNILRNMGVYFSAVDGGGQYYEDYYRSNISNDPTQLGYNGLMPLEHLYIAQNAVRLDDYQEGYDYPDVDDFEHFDIVMDVKSQVALEKFRRTIQVRRSGQSGLEQVPVEYNGSELFQKIISKAGESDSYIYANASGENVEIDAAGMNLSKFLAEYMQLLKTTSINDIISPRVENILKQNQVVVHYPPYYAPSQRKIWAMNKIASFVTENMVSGDAQTMEVFRRACGLARADESVREKFCPEAQRTTGPTAMMKIADHLGGYSTQTEFLPRRFFNDRNQYREYIFFKNIWDGLVRINKLDGLNVSEYDYVLGQLQENNPWARLRLSYLVAEDLLVTQRASSGGSSRSQSAIINRYVRNMDAVIRKMREAAGVLKINAPIKVSHANEILTKQEKTALFQNYVERFDEYHMSSLNLSYMGSESYLSKVEKLNEQTLLDTRGVDGLISREFPRLMRPEVRNEINSVLNSDQGVKGEFFIHLYRARGNVTEQQNLYNRYAQRHGINSSEEIKSMFLSLDASLKYPLYKDIIRKASIEKMLATKRKLQELCDLDPNSLDDYKVLFQLTMKQQNKLNALAQMPTVPENVIDRLSDWTAEDREDLIYGIGGIGLHMGAILVAGACTMATGPLCLPFAIGALSATFAGMGMQYKVLTNERNRYRRGQRYGDLISEFEQLGFSPHGANEEVRRSHFWTAVETIGLLTMIGTFVRGSVVGTRLLVASGRNLLTRAGTTAFRSEAQTIVANADVSLARYILGMDDTAEYLALGELGTQASELTLLLESRGMSPTQILEITNSYKDNFALMAQGSIDLNDFVTRMGRSFGPVANFVLRQAQMARNVARGQSVARRAGVGASVLVETSEVVINRHFARTLTQYVRNNPKELLNFVKSYSGKVDKAKRVLAQLQAPAEGWSIPVVGRIGRWFRTMRVEHLATQGDKILELERGLTHIAARGGNLEEYLFQNADLVTDALVEVPLRLQDVPYKFFEGLPQTVGIFFGKRVPILGKMAHNTNIRNIMRARSRLIYESVRAQARRTLGIGSPHLQAHSTYELYSAFQDSVFAAMTSDAQIVDKAQVLFSYISTENKIAENLVSEMSRRGKTSVVVRGQRYELTQRVIHDVVFNPRNDTERALAVEIWGSVDLARTLGVETMSGAAHNVIRNLSNYKSVDQFQDLVNALKIHAASLNPAAVEYF